MKLILQAIEALFRKTRIDNETILAEIDMTQKQIQKQIQEVMPFVINIEYDAEWDGDKPNKSFKEIEKAYLAGRIVILEDFGLPTEYIPGERIRFTRIEWGDEYVQCDHWYIHSDDGCNMYHLKPIKLV